MKKLAFFSTMALGLFLLLSCSGTAEKTNGGQTPLEYNNQIIAEQTKIMNLILEFGRNEDAIALEAIRLKIVDQAEKSVKVIKAMDGYEGSTHMRDAAVALFGLYLEASKTAYKEMIEILNKGEAITVEDVARITEIQSQLTEKEAPLDTEFQGAQKEFATKHKLMIQDNPLQQQIDNLGEGQ